MSHALQHKKILITAGRAIEVIDGVRHYANHARSEAHGFAVAARLAEAGAEVTIIAPKTHLVMPENSTVISKDKSGQPLLSGQSIMETAVDVAVTDDFDAVLCLASISAIKAATVSDQKIKAKQVAGAKAIITVAGNIDVREMAEHLNSPVAGYDTRQGIFASPDLPDWLAVAMGAVKELVQASLPVTEKAPADLPDAEPLFAGHRVIITSGPTVEPFSATGDVISNFSSGRQGRDIAQAFAQSGAEVIYVTGPTYLPDPVHPNIRIAHCESASGMLEICESNLPASVFIGVAAVADFCREEATPLKLRPGQVKDIALQQNPDILATMGQHLSQRPAAVIGFAAETDAVGLLDYAVGKLERKGADMICANLVGATINRRDSSRNQLTLVRRDVPPEELETMSKQAAAMSVVQAAAKLIEAKLVPYRPGIAAPSPAGLRRG